MATSKRHWLVDVLLWPNLAVAVLVLILIALNMITSLRQLGQIVAYALVYANLTSFLAVLLFGGLVGKLGPRKVPTFFICVFVAVPIGILAAQTLLWALGLVVPERFWFQYLHTVRACVPLAIIFGLASFGYESLRDRLRLTEQ